VSSEPQVTSSTATRNCTERVLMRLQTDLLPVYDVVGRWLHREPAFLHPPPDAACLRVDDEDRALIGRRPSEHMMLGFSSSSLPCEGPGRL